MSEATQIENQTNGNDTESINVKIQESDESKPTDEVIVLRQKVEQVEELQKKIDEMYAKIQTLEHELQARTEEKENYKNKIQQLETELKSQQNTLNPAQQNEVYKVKKQSEEMLTKAKGVIFDKTKLCQNQELRIEALTQQVVALKEVLNITKGLLEIRNIEVQHLEERMNDMETKINFEKRKHELLQQKLEAMSELNLSLKTEYETQLKLFNELREKYAEREQLLLQNKQA